MWGLVKFYLSWIRILCGYVFVAKYLPLCHANQSLRILYNQKHTVSVWIVCVCCSVCGGHYQKPRPFRCSFSLRMCLSLVCVQNHRIRWFFFSLWFCWVYTIFVAFFSSNIMYSKSHTVNTRTNQKKTNWTRETQKKTFGLVSLSSSRNNEKKIVCVCMVCIVVGMCILWADVRVKKRVESDREFFARLVPNRTVISDIY